MTRCRTVCANDHSPSTDTSTVPAGIAATRSSVAAQVRSSAAQAARRPSGSAARRSARPGKRRLSSASTNGMTSTPLTRRTLSPSKSHGASMSAPATSTARITTPDRSALTNLAPRRSTSTSSVARSVSDGGTDVMASPCRAPSREPTRPAAQLVSRGCPSRAGAGSPPRRGSARPSSLGLVGLGPGVVADDDVVGLLRHRARRLAAAGEDRLLGLVAGEPLERPGDDDGQPLEGARRGLVDLVGHPHAGSGPLVDDRAGASRRANHVDHGLGDDAADALDGGELLAAGGADRLHRARSARPARARRSGRRGGSTAPRAPATAAGSWPGSRLAMSLAPLADRTRPSTTASGGSVFFAARV